MYYDNALQEIKGINYDIITPKCMEDFRHGTWYDVEKGTQPQSSPCLPLCLVSKRAL